MYIFAVLQCSVDSAGKTPTVECRCCPFSASCVHFHHINYLHRKVMSELSTSALFRVPCKFLSLVPFLPSFCSFLKSSAQPLQTSKLNMFLLYWQKNNKKINVLKMLLQVFLQNTSYPTNISTPHRDCNDEAPDLALNEDVRNI